MKANYAISLKRSTALLAALTFMAVLSAVNLVSLFSNKVGAAQLSSRSLTLSSTLAGTETGDGTPGSPTNGSSAVHTFEFTTGATGSTATAIELKYCTEAIGTCTMPTGLVTTSATIGSPTGVTGLTIDSVATNGTIRLKTGTFGNTTATTIPMAGIVNPNVVDDFYVRIQTATADTYTTLVDDGTVASAITTGIDITAKVKETLGFSTTGSSAGMTAPGASCDPLTGSGAIKLGDTDGALSHTTAYDNYSAFRVFTNAANGLAVQYNADTLTKGPDNIDALTAETASTPGGEQFGLAVNTAAGSGATVPITSGGGSATFDTSNVTTSANLAANGPLTIDTNYDGAASDMFNFAVNTPTSIATSTSFTECKTVAVRYIANISPLTPAGTYTTKVVYSAVPTY